MSRRSSPADTAPVPELLVDTRVRTRAIAAMQRGFTYYRYQTVDRVCLI